MNIQVSHSIHVSQYVNSAILSKASDLDKSICIRCQGLSTPIYSYLPFGQRIFCFFICKALSQNCSIPSHRITLASIELFILVCFLASRRETTLGFITSPTNWKDFFINTGRVHKRRLPSRIWRQHIFVYKIWPNIPLCQAINTTVAGMHTQ